MMEIEVAITVRDQLKMDGLPVKSEFVIPSTIAELDILLNRGGLQNGRFTEIVGEKNCGKTSLAFQFCLSVQLPKLVGGPEGEAIYLSTKCNIARLSQMANGFMEKWNPIIEEEEKKKKKGQEQGQNEELEDAAALNSLPYFNMNGLLGKIGMYVCPTLPQLRQKVEEIVKLLESDSNNPSTNNVKLVVIDGIGSPTGDVNDNLTLFSDQFELFESQLLALLYTKASVSVIVTNTKQVGGLYSPFYFTPRMSKYYCVWFPLCQMIQIMYDAEQNKGSIRLVRTTYNESGEGFADFIISDNGICDDPEYVE